MVRFDHSGEQRPVHSNDLFYSAGAQGLGVVIDSGMMTGNVTEEITLYDAGTAVNEQPGSQPRSTRRNGRFALEVVRTPEPHKISISFTLTSTVNGPPSVVKGMPMIGAPFGQCMR